jgi:acetyl esterase/lipase
MDVYLPPAGQAIQGVIFMVHGGGWKHGDKQHHKVVNNKVARWVPKGLALVSINYRMLPEAPVQTQADDVRQALAQAQRLAPQWHAPADRFVLMGHSAGAHLVSLVSANPSQALAQGARPWLGVVSLDTAATNVPQLMSRRHASLYDDAFGTDPAYWQAMSPWHQLSAHTPPWLLVCSTERPDHPCPLARDFVAKAQALGSRGEVHPEALSHSEINDQLGLPGPYTDAVERFMAGLHPALAQALRP